MKFVAIRFTRLSFVIYWKRSILFVWEKTHNFVSLKYATHLQNCNHLKLLFMGFEAWYGEVSMYIQFAVTTYCVAYQKNNFSNSLNVKEWKSTLWRAIWRIFLFRVVFHSFRLNFASFWVIFHSVLEWNPLKEWYNNHSFWRAVWRTARNVKSGVFYSITFREKKTILTAN